MLRVIRLLGRSVVVTAISLPFEINRHNAVIVVRHAACLSRRLPLPAPCPAPCPAPRCRPHLWSAIAPLTWHHYPFPDIVLHYPEYPLMITIPYFPPLFLRTMQPESVNSDGRAPDLSTESLLSILATHSLGHLQAATPIQ
jgi:hypothetical protein